MGLALVMVFTMMCVGGALAMILFTGAREVYKRRGVSTGTVILCLLGGACVIFALWMGWMLLDIFRYM